MSPLGAVSGRCLVIGVLTLAAASVAATTTDAAALTDICDFLVRVIEGAAIPTLSAYSLGGLVVLLGLAAAVRIRRRAVGSSAGL